METIENKSKIGNSFFYIILVLLILGSMGATFYKIVWQKNYQIVAETSCDPQTEQGCYVWICDPANDETCPVDEVDRVSYYKIVSKKALQISLCEATEEKIGCSEELSCTDGEENCSYIYCNPDSLAEGENCVE